MPPHSPRQTNELNGWRQFRKGHIWTIYFPDGDVWGWAYTKKEANEQWQLVSERIKAKANLHTATQIAGKFSELLQAELTPSELQEARELNKTEEDSNVCHSHDFCDANMVMHEAFGTFGIDPLDDLDKWSNLWNSAWSLAKKYEFNKVL